MKGFLTTCRIFALVGDKVTLAYLKGDDYDCDMNTPRCKEVSRYVVLGNFASCYYIIQQMYYVIHNLRHTSPPTYFGAEVPSSGRLYNILRASLQKKHIDNMLICSAPS
jgi:hypothetical protein